MKSESSSLENVATETSPLNGKATSKDSSDGLTSKALRPFVIISSSYLLYTLTDGAMRMIVLLFAYNLKFSALEVALMFTLYETAGVFTNLAAGVMGAKWGIKRVLISGLLLQLVSLGMLFGWNPDWDKRTAIIYVTIAQMFGGIAKDLVKLGGKAVTKLVTPEDQQTRLFYLVSLITGFKNSLKGVGYFIGASLITVDYDLALSVLVGLILLALPWTIMGLDNQLGTAKKTSATWTEVFTIDNPNLNYLSLARVFLFASRDFWFEVPLPYYLRCPSSCDGLGTMACSDDDDCGGGALAELCLDGVCANRNPGGGCGGLGLSRVHVGVFLAFYIILYGQVQSWTPQLVSGPLRQSPPNKYSEILWGVVNCLPTGVLAVVMRESTAFADDDVNGKLTWLLVAILSFAVVFAINSSIHSYLVVKYAASDKVAVSVGFYYMANSCGRLFGTVASGYVYTYAGADRGVRAGHDGTTGMFACFVASTISSLLAAWITTGIKDDEQGLMCGPCLTCVEATSEYDDEDTERLVQAAETTDASAHPRYFRNLGK